LRQVGVSGGGQHGDAAYPDGSHRSRLQIATCRRPWLPVNCGIKVTAGEGITAWFWPKDH
jgi:hypothetical protein